METKLYASFSSAQLIRYHTPYCFDINNKSGGIPVYIKSSISLRCTSCEELGSSIQALPFEINLRKEKWLVISIHRTPSQCSKFCLNFLILIVDYVASTYGNHLMLGVCSNGYVRQ